MKILNNAYNSVGEIKQAAVIRDIFAKLYEIIIILQHAKYKYKIYKLV